MAQPRNGQAYSLPKSAADPRTTHVAVHKQHGFKYFCQLRDGSYWITPCDLYGSTYNFSSLWEEGFDFTPIDEWTE